MKTIELVIAHDNGVEITRMYSRFVHRMGEGVHIEYPNSVEGLVVHRVEYIVDVSREVEEPEKIGLAQVWLFCGKAKGD